MSTARRNLAVVLEPSHGTGVAVLGQRHRQPVRVDELLTLGQPERDLEWGSSSALARASWMP